MIRPKELSFNDCGLADLEIFFGLRRVYQSPELQSWINTPNTVDSNEAFMLEKIQLLLIDNVEHWNEQDLSLHFIGPLFTLVGFTERYRFNLFSQANLSAQIQDILLSGRVDELIASGYRRFETPFFCFNEYKKESDFKGDPAGQALAAMLVGEALNNAKMPIYGSYIVGRNWFFMVLHQSKYAISKLYDGTDIADLQTILKTLKNLKNICLKRTQPITNI